MKNIDIHVMYFSLSMAKKYIKYVRNLIISMHLFCYLNYEPIQIDPDIFVKM